MSKGNKNCDVYPHVSNFIATVLTIPQVDGNDSIDDDENFDITGLTESEIYERDTDLLCSGYVFEDDAHSTIQSTIQQPTLSVKTARFALNKDKQVNGLGVDASLPDFDIVVNDDDKNVNVQCSTAFYDAVAKPVICGLAKGTTLNIDNISIDCNHIDYNRDSNGFEYNRVLHIGIGGGGKFCIGKVTIHLHHSKRLSSNKGFSSNARW